MSEITSPYPTRASLTTQETHPWRAVVRTVFEAVVGFSSAWAAIVLVLGLDPDWAWVAASLAITGGVTRVMALPEVEVFLNRFVPWLAAAPTKE